MKKYIEDSFVNLNREIKLIEQTTQDLEVIINNLNQKIIENTNNYFLTDNSDMKEKIKQFLILQYDLLYYFQAKKNGLHTTYLLDDEVEKLPDVYLIDQKPERFEIDENILNTINISEGLTEEQAQELLYWTVNNTRDNINIGKNITGIPGDVYDNYNVMGYCGFSQFSSLYPLEHLGFEVTVNNIGEIKGGRHAYGTVVIPIKENNQIVNKRFLIDCTYRQFFTLPFNSFSRYISSTPDVAFYIKQDPKMIEFAKQLLKNGFIEATPENLENYLKPFFMKDYQFEDIMLAEKEFEEIDLLDAIQNRQVEFDYEEAEFDNWGCNLKLKPQENTMIL